jgi:aldose 1-epimerase
VTAAGGAIRSEVFGELDGRAVSIYTLTSPSGVEARICELGATLVGLRVPDRAGRLADVVLGFDDLASYAVPGRYFGCVVGRVANRIAGAHFVLDGREHALTANHGRHHLHGGARGFGGEVWRGEPMESAAGTALHLRRRSPDGEEGYPGAVEVAVVYTLGGDGDLRFEFAATTDRATPINLSQHAFWNLAGHDAGDVLGHSLEIAASRYTPAGAELIPTGAIAAVAGTPFDFRRARRLGPAIDELAQAGMSSADVRGFDVNYVLDGAAGELALAARLVAPGGARAMEVWTTAPGLQLYTGNFLSGFAGKRGARYDRHAGLCLETQAFPDAIHHQGERGWPSIVLEPGETYRQSTVHRFLAR